MLIVIEGTDGSGKSTLAYNLAAQIRALRPTEDVQVLHFGPPELHPLTEYEQVIDAYVPGGGTSIICDRLHWGEMVYSKLYRGGSRIGSAGFWHVEQALSARGAMMVYAAGDPDVIAKRQRDNGEDFLQPEHARLVYDEFDEIAHNAVQPVYIYDSTRGYDTTHTFLLIALAAESHGKTLTRWRDYVGPLTPDLLLVGERPNDNGLTSRPTTHTAAFVPYPESSGAYLIDQVITPLDLIEQRRIGLVNAYTRAGRSNDLDMLHFRLGRPRVVALGRVAESELKAQGVPHHYVPHPQYWKRFRHNEGREYQDLILASPRREAV